MNEITVSGVPSSTRKHKYLMLYHFHHTGSKTIPLRSKHGPPNENEIVVSRVPSSTREQTLDAKAEEAQIKN